MPRGRRMLLVLAGAGALIACAAWWFGRGPLVPRPADFESLDPAVASEVRWVSGLAALNPGSAAQRFRLAMVYDANGLHELAWTTYQQVVDLDPVNARAWSHLARESAIAGRTEDALAAIDEAIRLEPKASWLHWRKAFWLIDRQQLEEAEAVLTRALELDPESTMAMIGLARIRLQQQRHEDAEKALRRVPSTDGNYGYSCVLRGQALAGLGRAEEARIEASRGALTRPILTDPWQHEVMAHRRSYLLLMEEARNRIDAGKPELAIAIIESLLERQPDDANLINNMSAALLATGQLDRAEQFLLQAQQRLPADDGIPMNLGVIRHKRGDAAAAIAHSRQAIELNPLSGKAHLHLGVMLCGQGQTAEGIRHLEQALDLGADQLAARLELGRALLKDRRAAEAEKAFRQAILHSPHSSSAQAGHAQSLMELSRMPEAWAAARQARRLHPVAQELPQIMDRLHRLGPEPPEQASR